MDKNIFWLLSANPVVEFNTRMNLFHQDFDQEEVKDSKRRMLEDPLIRSIIKEFSDWPGPPLKRHNDANHLLHKLVFLADIGLNQNDPKIESIAQKIFKQQSEEGPFRVSLNISPSYGGSGKDELAWLLCDTPLITYALAKLGWKDDPQVIKSAQSIAALIQEVGCLCTGSEKIGKFRGPGKKTDPCPYATLVSLKALQQFPNWIDSHPTRLGVETLLSLWEQRKTRRPYLFAMGTDFKKLKAPLIWYDILHVTEVLTNFDWIRNDPRLLEMVDIIKTKADPQDRYTPESVWQAWKNWDFSQKKEPSPWISYLVYRILNRVNK